MSAKVAPSAQSGQRKTTRKRADGVPAKQEVGRPAKPAKQEVGRPAKGLTVSTAVIETDDLADELFSFAKQPRPQNLDGWRTEFRKYEKQDGTVSVYFNYRSRKSIKVKGKRVYPYRKGGKYEL